MINVKQYSKQFKQKTYTSQNVIVNRGALPLIITAGHGGRDRPFTIPDRKQEGNILLSDMYTREIAEEIEKGIQEYYKEAPHLIVNLISRRKLDVNRRIEEGTESKSGELVWKEYHGFVRDAINCLLEDYSYGLLIDIHGHTHPEGMVELGYLLEPADLESNFDKLDQAILEKSSIQSLAKRYAKHTRPYQIMLESIGDLISSGGDVKVDPSSLSPKPTRKDYFRGGYVTETYHQNNSTSGMDVLQIEIPKEFRYTEEGRNRIIKVLVKSIISILDRYYLVKSKL